MDREVGHEVDLNRERHETVVAQRQVLHVAPVGSVHFSLVSTFNQDAS